MNPTQRKIVSERAAEPVGAYPHARQVGNLLFLSGIGPRKRGSTAIPGVKMDEAGAVLDYDIVEEAQSVFRNIRFILEDAGSAWENIVDVTVFLTSIERDFKRFNEIYREHFGSIEPCRTTVEVNRLPTPIHVELKVIATIG
ncbi:2-aminomuconate deaminase [Gemmata sp. SH-PL17]|uniref:RidA family protein n=1 Tax=Gemmata sp. SH-PL17 TaxID=1630693 RepID=UPI00078DDDBD|nr:RidA family protein [Gemmata sp. SH-PL17]AMV23910.1 2-aminomuconate deaminase [Gemmata sp. SH-PL17]